MILRFNADVDIVSMQVIFRLSSRHGREVATGATSLASEERRLESVLLYLGERP